MHDDRVGAPKADLHLEQICSAMMEAWFPADDEVLNKIRGGLNEGRYSENRSLLLQDLKEDQSLFLYCIRELIRLLTLSGRLDKVNPLQVLEAAKEEELRHVLDVDCEVISLKRKQEMSPTQAARMFETAVSATTAETLASHCEISEDLAYACSIFRQLGLTLIAWNYPFVYKRVAATIRPTESLDGALQRVLGFSPSALGITIGRRWRLSDDVMCSLGDPDSESAAQELRELGERIGEVCRLGEAVGRVSAAGPEGLSTDWEKAKGAIQDILGPRGFSAIQSAISAKCAKHMQGGLGTSLSMLLSEQPALESLETGRRQARGRAAIEANAYISALPEEARTALSALYSRAAAGAGPNEIMHTFSGEVLPLSGFSKGAVFVLQADGLSLVMTANHGRCDLAATYKVGATTTNDPIISAYRHSHLVSEQNALVGGRRVSYISGVLGENQRRGVLYAEIDDQVFKWLEANPMNCFRAIQQGLADCLGVE